MSKIERITSFIAVVDENGFAAAARKVGVSTAAISRQVSLLEAELNALLLIRTTRRLSLTEIGTQYYQRCKHTLESLMAAETAIVESQQEAIGTLFVTSNRYFAKQYLLPRLSEFIRMNPKLHIKIDMAERYPDLEEKNIDILFGVSLEGSANLIRKRIATTRYVLCASPEYLKLYGTPSTPMDLTKHAYITHSMRRPDNCIEFKQSETVILNPTLSLNDSDAIKECAILGTGIVRLHEYIVSDALKDGRLIEVLRKFQEEHVPIYLYYQQNKYLQPKIRRFIDFFS
jgi:DNA-binding transcriptional LysR family regulator